MAVGSGPDSLTEFVGRRSDPEWSVQIVNRTDPEPVARMLRNLFEALSIEVSEVERPAVGEDVLLLLRDGEVVEASPVEDLKRTLLFVNADLYRTGTRSLDEIDPPGVITSLSNTVFTLRGFPESNVEKLVLILLSRVIEHRAWRNRSGTLRTSFQWLSRLDDESGTREVYERLGRTPGVGVHVYGVPDWEPPDRLGLVVHGITRDEILRHWFVVHRTDEGSGGAMVATATGPNEWEGFWTFDPATVRRIDRYVRDAF